MRKIVLACAFWALLAVCACGGGDDAELDGTDGGSDAGGPAVGAERGACYPNGTCDEGLTCASNLCVVLPKGDAGSQDVVAGDTGASPDAGGSPDTGGTPDAGGADGGDAGETDGGGPKWTLSGKLNLNGAPPGNAAAEVTVVVGSTAPGDDMETLGETHPSADGSYSIDGIREGTCHVFAKYEHADFIAYGESGSNPVVADRDVSGVDVNVFTVSAAFGSLTGRPGALFYGESGLSDPIVSWAFAMPFDPSAGDVATGATVSVSGGSTELDLVFDSNLPGFKYEWGVSAGGPYVAVAGTYTFKVTHALYGGAVDLDLPHDPLTVLPEITKPAGDTSFPSPRDVEVDWNGVTGAEAAFAYVFNLTSGSGDPAFYASAEDGTLSKPLIVPASSFEAGSNYEIGVYVSRQASTGSFNGNSIEMSMDYVKVGF